MEDSGMFSRNHLNERFFKIISIFGFFLLMVVLTILVQVEPASSYEFSIYDAYSWYLWGFLISAILCGLLIIIGSGVVQSKKNYWLFGVFIILISDAILLFLPMIRGYYGNSSGDVLTHIGYMNNILQTTSMGNDHYPIDHIFGAIVYLISGLPLLKITYIIPSFFSFFFILSIYFAGKTIFKNTFALSILVALSSVLILQDFHIGFLPNYQALLLLPLILYLVFKMYRGVNGKKYYGLLLLICFLIVFYHPLVAVLVILTLCLMQIMQYILEKYENKNLIRVNYSFIIIFMIAVFSLWSSYLRMATLVTVPIIEQLLGKETAVSEMEKNFAYLSRVNVDPLYLIQLIFNLYGQWIILGILSLLCIGLILKLMVNQQMIIDFYSGSLVMGFVLFFILSIFMFFFNGAFGFARIYTYATVFSLLLIPIGGYLFLNNNPKASTFTKKTPIKLLGIIFIFFFIVYFSTFNLHFSPIVRQANNGVFKSEYIGMHTVFSYMDESIPFNELQLESFRYYDAQYTQSERLLKSNLNETIQLPPDHFGYQNTTLLNNFQITKKYLLINDQGRGYNLNINPGFENQWSFGPKDFDRVEIDPNIRKIYSNGNLELLLIS